MEDAAAGWDAITQAFRERYPEQEDPLHFGTLISWKLGGPDPLDGVSVYDAGDSWHFVTYGFSDLYDEEESADGRSGYGFELTVLLKKNGLPANDDPEIRCMAGILQSLARYAFEEKTVFEPFEYIYTGQASGMDAAGHSKLTGFATAPDSLGEINTPNGTVKFVLIVGVTDKELRAVLDHQTTVRALLERLGRPVTDYGRDEIPI